MLINTPHVQRTVAQLGLARLAPVMALVLAMFMYPVEIVAQEREILTKAEWPAVRTGQTIIATAPLKRVMDRFAQNEEATILIRFPGGNLGNAWAFELRDWLVALGVPSNQIRLEPGSGVVDAMSIMVI